MYTYERVRARNFARTWGFVQCSQAIPIAIGVPISGELFLSNITGTQQFTYCHLLNKTTSNIIFELCCTGFNQFSLSFFKLSMEKVKYAYPYEKKICTTNTSYVR